MFSRLIIISGGQSGAGRAGLDFAIKQNLPHGGWCPQGSRAPDGPLDVKYLLKETPSAEDLECTEWNVRDSDATVVFTLAEKATGGAQKTLTFARKHKKPFLQVHRGTLGASEKLRAFLEKHNVRRLNVAGSKDSEEPGIYERVVGVLDRLKLDSEG